MKYVFYMFAIWVMFNNGQVYRYPQAAYWMSSGARNHETFELRNGMTGKLVVELRQSKVKFVHFKRIASEYHTYQNPNIPLVNPDVEVVMKHGMRIAEEMHQ